MKISLELEEGVENAPPVPVARPARNFMIQSANAAEWRAAEHKRLLGLGFTWDGADGYTAPDGWDINS